MRSLLALALLTVALPAAEPARLTNPSFEDDTLGWTLTWHGGAEGSLTVVPDARTGQRALRLEKTNGLGYGLLTAPLAAVEAGREYESVMHTRVLDYQHGARIYFVNIDSDHAGNGIGQPHYSPSSSWRPTILPGDEWSLQRARWTPAAGAVETQLRLVFAGNPMTVLLDDAELTAEPEPLAYPGRRPESSEPPYDEAVARANLAKRVAQPADVETVGGQPIVVAGEHRSALIHQGSYWRPQNSRYANFGRRDIHLQTVAVQFGPYPDLPETAWKYPGGFDFSALERNLLQAVGADPEVRVILQVRCDLPGGWQQDNLDHVQTAENGQRFICSDGMHPDKLGTSLGEKETYMVSYGSPKYQADVAAALRELGRFVRENEVGRIVAGYVIGGGSDGQFLTGTVGHQLDHSAGHQEGFRDWLKEQYPTVEALRAAWDDPDVTFETATVCPESWRTPDSPFLTNTGRDRRAADSNRFDSIAPAQACRRFAEVLETEIGRPLVGICYWSDAIHDQGSNRYAVPELLAGGWIEAVASVNAYSEQRAPGGTGGINACWGTHRLHGSMMICELDYRTYLSSMGGTWGPAQLGATTTVDGFRAQVRRDIGAAAARGIGAWFYDMGGVWYDDPPLWDVIAEAERTLDWSHRPDAPRPEAELAVFVDESAGWRISEAQLSLLNRTSNQQRWPLNLSGVPHDLYLLDDLLNPNLPEYKAYLLLTPFGLDAPHVEALQRLARRAGKTLIVRGTAGLGSWDYDSPLTAIAALTGLTFGLRPAASSAVCLPAPGDPLGRGLEAAIVGDGTWPVETLVPDPGAMQVFGRYLDEQPSHAVARTEAGTIVQLNGDLTPRLVHNLAREAGITTFGTPGQVTYVGCGVAVAHRVQPGELRVTFGKPVDLIDPATEQVTAAGVSEWSPEVKLLDTALIYYRPAR